MPYFYEVNETQVLTEEGSPVAVNPVFYTNKEQAESAYFTACAAAAVSTIPYHAVNIIRSDGVMVRGEIYDRRGQGE